MAPSFETFFPDFMMNQFFLYVFFFISGISGLGYEILWTRMLSVSLGHEIISMLAVVSAFFSGLAIGAWILDRPVSRSKSPGRWYALFEVCIGLWSIILVVILPGLNLWVSDLIGISPSPFRHWSVSFFYPFLILLPATFAMGGTLPAMDRFIGQIRQNSRTVAGVYSINTLGSVAGTLLVAFFLVPKSGMNNTAYFLMIGNLICAAGSFILANIYKDTNISIPISSSVKTGRGHVYVILFATGLAGIGFEVVMVRVLSQVFQNTVYSFAAILMVYLLGTGIGAGIFYAYQNKRSNIDFKPVLSFLLLSTAAFSAVTVAALQYVAPLYQFLHRMLGQTFPGAVTAELLVALLYFLFPTAAMGATFTHLAQSLKNSDSGVGRALCLNIAGCSIAPLLFGVFLLPGMGIKYTILMIPTIYLLCLPELKRSYVTAGISLMIVMALFTRAPDSYRFVSLEGGDTLLSHKQGVMASVSVIKDKQDGVHLKVNNHFQMGGTTSVFSDRRQAYLPILLHKHPHKALFLGVGTGTTFAAAGQFKDLSAVGVELIPEVIDAMAYFEKTTGNLEKYDNLHMVNADARRYVTTTHEKFDIIIADLFHPARDGAGSLYTLEHFTAIRNLLTETGVFCQWLPLYQMDLETLKIIINTFLNVYPDGQAWLAHYSVDQPIIGLIAGKHPFRFPENWLRKRVTDKNFKRHMAGYGYDSIYSLLGTFLAGGKKLEEIAGGCPVNTDAFPVVQFRAPQFVYQQQEPPRERLLTLLTALSPPDPESILAEVVTEEDYLARSRISAYWTARDSFLNLGARVEQTKDVTKLYETTSRPLLEVVRQSIDFSAAYYPLISIAYELFPHNRDASYTLLRDLERANPLRPEAGILRQRLFAGRN